jgi:hypothetical protein
MRISILIFIVFCLDNGERYSELPPTDRLDISEIIAQPSSDENDNLNCDCGSVIPSICRKASRDAGCGGGFGGKVIEVSWIVLGFGEILWGDSKLKDTTFYVDRLSPIATMHVMTTFA